MLLVSAGREEGRCPEFGGVRLTRQSTHPLSVPITSGGATRHPSHEGADEEVHAHPDQRERNQYETQLLGVHHRAARGHRPAAETPPHGHTVGMKDAFPIVIIGISLIAIVVAVGASLASGGLYERIGRGGFAM